MAGLQDFIGIAKRLADETHALGLVTPGMRTRYPGQRERRVLRRFPDAVVVAVDPHQDPWDLARDLIDGIVAANELTDPVEVETIRGALWASLDERVAA